jgi:hypothetical protein
MRATRRVIGVFSFLRVTDAMTVPLRRERQACDFNDLAEGGADVCAENPTCVFGFPNGYGS